MDKGVQGGSMSTGIQEILGQMLQNLQCPICLELMNNPVSTSCNHRFCSFCINSFFKARPSLPCPLCKASVTKRSIEKQSQLSNVIQQIKQLIDTFEAETVSPVKNSNTFFPSTPETLVTKRKSNAKRKHSAESSTRVLRSRSSSSEKAKNQEISSSDASTKSHQGATARKKIFNERLSSEVQDDSTSNIDNGDTNIFKALCEHTKEDDHLPPFSSTENSDIFIPGSKVESKAEEDNTDRNVEHITDGTDLGSKSSDVEDEHHVKLLQYLQEGSCGSVRERNPRVSSAEKEICVRDEGKDESEPASPMKAKTEKSSTENRKRKSKGVCIQIDSSTEEKAQRNLQLRNAKLRSNGPAELEPLSQDTLHVQPVVRTYTKDMRRAFKAEKAKTRRLDQTGKEANPGNSSLVQDKGEDTVLCKQQKKKTDSPVPRNMRKGKSPNKQDTLLVEEIEDVTEVISKTPPPVCLNRRRIFRNKNGLYEGQEAKEESTVFKLPLSQDPFEFKGETPTKETKKAVAEVKKRKGKKSKAPSLNFCHSNQQTEEEDIESKGTDVAMMVSRKAPSQLYNDSDGVSVPRQNIDSILSSKNEQCFSTEACVTSDGVYADGEMNSSQIELFSGEQNCSNQSVRDAMCGREIDAPSEVKPIKKRASKRKMQQKAVVEKTNEITVASQEIRKMQSKISEAEVHELMFSTQEAQKYMQEQNQQVTVHENEGSAGTMNSPDKEQGTVDENEASSKYVRMVPVNSLNVCNKNRNIVLSQSGCIIEKTPDHMDAMETNSACDLLIIDNIHGDNRESCKKGLHCNEKDQYLIVELAKGNHSVGDLAKGNHSVRDLAKGNHSVGDLAKGNHSVRDLAKGNHSVGELTKDHHSVGDLPKDNQSVGDLPKDNHSVGELMKDNHSVGDLAKDNQLVGELATNDHSVGDLAKDNHSVGDLAKDHQSFGELAKVDHSNVGLTNGKDIEKIVSSCTQVTPDIRKNLQGKLEQPLHNLESTNTLTIIERPKMKPQFSVPNLASMMPFNPMFLRSLPNSPSTSCKVNIVCETPLTVSSTLNTVEVTQNRDSGVTKVSSSSQRNGKSVENDLSVRKTSKEIIECGDETPINISAKDLFSVAIDGQSSEKLNLTDSTESQGRTCSSVVPMSANILQQKAEKVSFNSRVNKATLSLKSKNLIESEKEEENPFDSVANENCHIQADILAPETCVEDPSRQSKYDSHNLLGVTFIPETEMPPTVTDVEALYDCGELSQTKQQQEKDGQVKVCHIQKCFEENISVSQPEIAFTDSQPISSTYVVAQGRKEGEVSELPEVNSENSSDSSYQDGDTAVSSAKPLDTGTLSNNVMESSFSAEDTLKTNDIESQYINRDKSSCSDNLNLPVPHKTVPDTEAQNKKEDSYNNVNKGVSSQEKALKEMVNENMSQTCENSNEVQDISDYEDDEGVLMFYSGKGNLLKGIQHLPKSTTFDKTMDEKSVTGARIPHLDQPKSVMSDKVVDEPNDTRGTFSEVNKEELQEEAFEFEGKCPNSEFNCHHLQSQDEFKRKSKAENHTTAPKPIYEEVGKQKDRSGSDDNSMAERVDGTMASDDHTENENLNSMTTVIEGESQSILHAPEGRKNLVEGITEVTESESQSILHVPSGSTNEDHKNGRISEDSTLSSSKTDGSVKNSLRQVTKPSCENITPQKMGRKFVENSLSLRSPWRYPEETSSPSKKRAAWTTVEELTPPKKKTVSSRNNPEQQNEKADMSATSKQMDQVDTENLTPFKSQSSEENSSTKKSELSKKKTKRGLALKNNELDFNSLPQHPNEKLSPAAKAALDLEFSKVSKISEWEKNVQKLKEPAANVGVKDSHACAEIQTNLETNDYYSPYKALDHLRNVMRDVEKEKCRSGKDDFCKIKDSEKSQKYASGKESALNYFHEHSGQRDTIVIENDQEELNCDQVVSESSLGGLNTDNVATIASDNSLEELNKENRVVSENDLDELNRDDIVSESGLEESNRDKADNENSQDFNKNTFGEDNLDKETATGEFDEDSNLSPAISSQHDDDGDQDEDNEENEALEEKREESQVSKGDTEVSFDLGISLDEEDCDLLPLTHSSKVSQPDVSLHADENPHKHPEMSSCKKTNQDNASSNADESKGVEMVEESDLEDSPVTVPKTSSPMKPKSDLSGDEEESLICEEEDENGGDIVPPKKRRRLQIASDSEVESDTEKANLSQDNATSSSAFSSQSELLNTQQQEALEKDVVALQQDIAECEAALQDIDDSGPQTQIPKAQSSSIKSELVVFEEVQEQKKPSATGEEAENDEEDSEDDLFICYSSPSPLKAQMSLSVQRVPVLNKENPSLRNKFFKQFQSPGGSVHKRRALEFTQRKTNTELDSDRGNDHEPTNEPTSPVISSQGMHSGKLSHKKATEKDSIRCASSSSNISLVASGLKGHEQEILKKFRHRFHVKFNAKFVPGVSHVIVKSVTDHKFMCERTLKFFQGMVHKAWILDFSWVSRSLEEGHILKENEFEIHGDTCSGELSCGPTKARLSSQPLLKDFSFACIGNCKELPRNELKGLLEACGACVVEDIIALPLSSSKHKFIIRCNDLEEEPSHMEKTMLKSVHQQTGLLTLNRDWVLDCISSHQVIQVSDYQLKL